MFALISATAIGINITVVSSVACNTSTLSLNDAAGLIVVSKEKDFKKAYNYAKQHLKSGKVFYHLQKIQSI